MHAPWNSYTGGRFHEWFSIAIQIRCKFIFVLILVLTKWSPQLCCRGMRKNLLAYDGRWLNYITTWIFSWFWIATKKKKSFMKWTPGHKHDCRTAMCAYVQNRFAIILQQTVQMYTLSFGKCILTIMTSWHENTFFITGPLWGVYFGHQWISPTKGQLCNTLMLSCIKEVVGRIIELSVIWEVVTLVWHHRDACMIFFF